VFIQLSSLHFLSRRDASYWVIPRTYFLFALANHRNDFKFVFVLFVFDDPQIVVQIGCSFLQTVVFSFGLLGNRLFKSPTLDGSPCRIQTSSPTTRF